MDKRQISENFVNRIKELKARTGLTNGEFAKKIGISTSALNNYLYGKTNDANGEKEERIPNIETSIKMCELFGVSLDYLFGLDNEEHPNNEYITSCTGLTDKSIEVLRQMNKTRPPQTVDGVTVINKDFDNAYLNIEALNIILEDSYNNWLEKERTSKRKSVPYNTPLYYLYKAIFSERYKSVRVNEFKGKIALRPQESSDQIFLHDNETGEYFFIQSSDILKRICLDKITAWINERGEALDNGKH